MIRYARTCKQVIRQMWKRCFNDSTEFLDLYFDNKYKDENTLIKIEGDIIAASLQILPHDMVFCNNIIKTGYIAGAATLPEYRKRGFMHDLIIYAMGEMRKKQMAVSTLIPQEEWLFSFYQKFGFVRCFDRYAQKITLSDKDMAEGVTVTPLEEGEMFHIFIYYLASLRNIQGAILKSFEDFCVMVKDHRMGGGEVYICRREEKILGIAFPIIKDNKLIIKEMHCENEYRDSLLCTIFKAYSKDEAEEVLTHKGGDITPLGMGRVVDIFYLLCLYAKDNPSRSFTMRVTDKLLPWNNGVFIVKGGQCGRVREKIEIDFNLTIEEITKLILGYETKSLYGFKEMNLYMNMMLN